MNTVVEELPHCHRITVDEYYRMAERGVFAPEARMELIEGEIIDMAPLGDLHMAAVDRLARLLIRVVGDRAIVRNQGAVRLGDLSMPQPDFVLLKPREDFYRHKSATAADALLVIEVSDTTLHHDLGRKIPLYARHGIPEAWVLDLQGRRVHFFRSPRGESFAEFSVEMEPGTTPIAQLPDTAVDLSWLSRA